MRPSESRLMCKVDCQASGVAYLQVIRTKRVVMEKVAQIDKDILKGILLNLINGKKTVTYADLSKTVEGYSGRRINPHVGFNAPLGRIQYYCIESNAPCLSALVVNQDQVPGPGFIDCFRKANPHDPRADHEIVEEEQRACLENKDWSPLLERCGIQADELWEGKREPLNFDTLNWSALVPILDQYEDDMAAQRGKEIYKWEAVKHFRNHWNIDAADFHEMLRESLSKTQNLLTSRNYLPKGMIEILADNDPESVRSSFRMLMDNSVPLNQRMDQFSSDMDEQLEALNVIRQKRGERIVKNHFQDPHAMSVYLALAQDDRHYIYKARPYESFAARVGAKTSKDRYEKVEAFEGLCDSILSYLLERRNDLVKKSDDLLPEELREVDESRHMLAQDIVFYANWGIAKNWAYAPGEQAKYWEDFKNAGIMGIGWSELGNPSRFNTKKELKQALVETYDEGNPKNDTDSIWAFVNELKPGDIIWARRGTKHVVGCGIVKSDFRYEEDSAPYHSVREVEWAEIDEFDVEGAFHFRTIYELTEKTSVKTSNLEALSQGIMDHADDDWWPGDDEYTPGLTSEEWLTLIGDESVFREESLIMLSCLRAIGGQATVTELAEAYGRKKNWYLSQAISLAKRIVEREPRVKPYIDDANLRWWPILFVGKVQASDAPGSFIWRIRDELAEALDGVDWSKYDLEERIPEIESSEKSYWWLNASPKIWSFSDIEPGEEQTYTVLTENSTPRRIHANFMAAKEGDVVIGYEATPVKKVVAICEISRDTDDENLYFRKLRDLASPIPYSTIKEDDVLAQSQFVKSPNGSLFALSKDEFDRVIELAGDDVPILPAAKAKPYSDKQFLEDVYISASNLASMKRLLERKKNLILQGAPGTGKTYCAKRLAWAFMGEEDNNRICFVQFHQNTTYDDMMAGYRPADDGGFEAIPGEFLRFCDKAAQDSEQRPWFFIIDEINRANVSKVFGELLMLIESGHRDEAIKLSLLGRSVKVPSNLYIIGMMNTADRGLALIDYALRRRFAFFEMEPAFRNEQFMSYIDGTGNRSLAALAEAVDKLNKEIASDPSFGTGFRIGHSYFCLGDDVSDEDVVDVVEYELDPLVREYWFDAPDTAEEKIAELRAAL